MRLALIPAGKFLMGGEAPAAQIAAKFSQYASTEASFAPEHPQHEVTISKPFYMGMLEVTRDQWVAVMGPGPWKGKKCDRADSGNIANHISWEDASAFCRKLSAQTGKSVALPTEAQWEYACRAKSTSAFYFGDDEARLERYGWYAANTLGRGASHPHTAGRMPPNRWGLYDMHGNIQEWCRDWYDEKFYAGTENTDPENTTKSDRRVLRGGHWGLYPDGCRSAFRSADGPTVRKCSRGFRVVIAAGPGEKPE